MGVRDLSLYNNAAILDQTVILWNLNSHQRWAQLETNVLTNVTCRDILVFIYLGLQPLAVPLLSLSHLFQL